MLLTHPRFMPACAKLCQDLSYTASRPHAYYVCRFLNELGTVSPAEQRKELFGDQTTSADNKETDTTTVPAPKDSQAKKAE